MEDDRAAVDLGPSVDLGERIEEHVAIKQPKKRFVGRRQATENAAKQAHGSSIEDSGAVQGGH